MTYRIRTVSEMTGIPRNTLIAWERRYQVVEPARHDNGYRSYSEEDVARLLRIKNALKAGLKISEAVSLMKNNDAASASNPPLQAAVMTEDKDAFTKLRDQLFDALIDYRKDDADRLLAQLMPIPFSTRLHEIYFPVLRKIGDLWEAGELTIAQEHYASAVLRSHFASILVSIGPANTHAPHAACTTFPGDMHEMAALALSIQLSLNGYRISYLGANLPVEELAGFYEKQKPELTCVSVISPVEKESVAEYIRHLSGVLKPESRLVLGGTGVRGIELATPTQVELAPAWEDLSM